MPQKKASRTSREQHDEQRATGTSQQLGSRQGQQHGRAMGTQEHTEAHRQSRPRQQGSKGAAGGMHGFSDPMRPHQTPERPRRGASNSSNWFSSPPRFNGAPALFQPSPGQHGASPAQQYLGNDLINLFQSPVRPVTDAAALDLRLAETPGSTPLPASGSILSPSPAPRSRGASGGRPRARAVSLEAVGWDLRGQQQGAASSSLGGLPPGLLGADGAEAGIQDMVSDLLRSPSAKDTPRRMTRSLAAAVALASPPPGAATAAAAALASPPSGGGTAAGAADGSSLTPLVGKLQRRRCLDFSRAGGAHSSSASRQVRAFKSEAAATGPSAMISCQPHATPLPLQPPQQQQQQPAPAASTLEAPTIDHLLLPEALAAAADVVAAGAAGQMDSPDARGGLGPVLTLLGRGCSQQLLSPLQGTSTTRLAAGSSTLLTPISRRLQLPRHRGAGGGGPAAEAEEASPAGDDLDLLPLLPLQPGGSQQEGRLLEALSPGGNALPDTEQQYSSRAGAQDASAGGASVSRVMRRGARKTRPLQQQQQQPLPGAPQPTAGGPDIYDSDSHPVYNCVKGLRSLRRGNSSGSGGSPDGSHRVPLQQLQAPNSSSKRSSRARKRSLKYAAALLAEQGYVEEEQEGYERELALQCAEAQQQQQHQYQQGHEQGPDPDMFAVAAAAAAALPGLDRDVYQQQQEAAAASDEDGGGTAEYHDLPWSSQQPMEQEGQGHAAADPAVSMAVCSDWEEEEGQEEQEEEDEELDSQDAPVGRTSTRSRSRSRGRGRGRAQARGRASASRQRGTQPRAVQAVQVMPPRRSAAAGGGRDPSPKDAAHPLAGLRPPPVDDLHVAVQEGRRSCRCKKSMCLKLYCECFSAGVFCFACSCRGCHNNTQHQAEVQEQRWRIMQRDPDAFSTKLRPNQPSSRKGCNCRKSHCLKKYCDCFQMGVRCSDSCKCSACENTEELLGPSAPQPSSSSVPIAPPLAPAAAAAALPQYAAAGGNDWAGSALQASMPAPEVSLPAAPPMMPPAVGMTPSTAGVTPVSATPQVADLGPVLGSGAGGITARQQLFRRGGEVAAPGQGDSGVVGNLADRFEQAVKQEPGLPVPSETAQVRTAHAMSRGTARVLAAARELAPRLNRSSGAGPSKAGGTSTMGAPQLRHSSSGGGAAVGGDASTPTRLQTPDQQAPWPASCTPSSRGSSCDGGGAPTTAAAAWAAAVAAGEGGVAGAGRGRHRLSTSSSDGAAQLLQLASPPEGAGLMPPPTGRPGAGSRQSLEAGWSSTPGSGGSGVLASPQGLAEQQQQQHDSAGRSLMECDETVPADLDPAVVMGAPAGVTTEGTQWGAVHQRLTPLKRKLEADGEPQGPGSCRATGEALLATPGTAAAAAAAAGACQLDASMLQDMRLVYIADTQCLALVPASALQGVLGNASTAAVPLPVGTPGLRTPGSAAVPGGLAAARGAAAGDGRVVYSGQLLGAAGPNGRLEAAAPHIPVQPHPQHQRTGRVAVKSEPGATPQHAKRGDQSQQRSLSSSTPPAAAAPHGRLLHCPSSLTPSQMSFSDATPPPSYASASAGGLLGSGPSLPLQMQQVGSPALGPGPLQLLKAGAGGQGFASPPPAGMTSAQQVLSPNSGSVLSPTGGRLLFRFSPGPTRLTPAEQP